MSPFSRRVLDPQLVRLLHFSSVANRFELLDLVGLAVAAVVVFILAVLVGKELRLPGQLLAPSGAMAAGIFLCSPYAVRMTKFAPVLVDEPAIAIGTLTVLALLASDRTALFVAPPLALLAALTRESWIAPVAGAALVIAVLREGRRLAVALTLSAAALGGLIGLAQAHLGKSLSALDVATGRFRYYSHAHGQADLAYQLALGVGLVPLLLLLWLLRDRPRLRNLPLVSALLVAGAVNGFEGVIGGSDTGRICYAALPLLLPVAAAVATTSADRVMRWAAPATAVVSVIVWQPWATLQGLEPAYPFLLYFTHRSQRTFVVLLAAFASLTLLASASPRSPADGTPSRSAERRTGQAVRLKDHHR